jgi:hypothetical protein
VAQEGYEALREYILSPAKNPSRPLGLDLWNKKGFLTWAATALRHDVTALPSARAANEATCAPPSLAVSMANILNDWSDRHGRFNGKQQNQA